jgi:hypothetical protein
VHHAELLLVREKVPKRKNKSDVHRLLSQVQRNFRETTSGIAKAASKRGERMRTSSAKAKGRRACQELQTLILRWFPDLSARDVRVTPSGSTGEDIQLSEAGAKAFPYAVEVKNQERLNIWQSLLQTTTHATKLKLQPLLAFRRNRSELWVAIRAEHFFELAGVVDTTRASAQRQAKSPPVHDSEGPKHRSFGFGDDE